LLGSDPDFGAVFEDGFAAPKRAGANLWTGQIEHDSDRPVHLSGYAANALYDFAVVVALAVRHIDARYVHPGGH
jgi:hypothetical protein